MNEFASDPFPFDLNKHEGVVICRRASCERTFKVVIRSKTKFPQAACFHSSHATCSLKWTFVTLFTSLVRLGGCERLTLWCKSKELDQNWKGWFSVCFHANLGAVWGYATVFHDDRYVILEWNKKLNYPKILNNESDLTIYLYEWHYSFKLCGIKRIELQSPLTLLATDINWHLLTSLPHQKLRIGLHNECMVCYESPQFDFHM